MLLKAAYFMEDFEKVGRETQGSPGVLLAPRVWCFFPLLLAPAREAQQQQQQQEAAPGTPTAAAQHQHAEDEGQVVAVLRPASRLLEAASPPVLSAAKSRGC